MIWGTSKEHTLLLSAVQPRAGGQERVVQFKYRQSCDAGFERQGALSAGVQTPGLAPVAFTGAPP
jgi:hypothetical protein